MILVEELLEIEHLPALLAREILREALQFLQHSILDEVVVTEVLLLVVVHHEAIMTVYGAVSDDRIVVFLRDILQLIDKLGVEGLVSLVKTTDVKARRV